ncbi:MAG: restriction endonuclease subunit S [Candidatus Electrothrix sp. Rat3]|nr:restriction endonuclease subunit S [Candidatus Electrothrix rattekaaiensis]
MKIKKVGEVAEVNPRLLAGAKPDSDDLISFVPMAAVSEVTLSIEKPVDRPYSEVAKGFTSFRRGDILIAKITPCFENGKMAYTQNLPRDLGFGSTEFHVLRPKENLEGAYLFHLLRAPLVRRSGKMKMKGAAGQRRVPADFFANLQIPLPPLVEQKRIAKILDATDALRAKRREGLAQLDILLQSTFLDMFGDPVTNPMGWNVTLVEDEVHFLTSGSRGWAKYYADSGDVFIRIQNLKNGNLDLSDIAYVNAPESAEAKRTKVEPGDVLLSITADLGRTAVVPNDIGKAHINQHLAILRFKELNPVFVSYQLASHGGQSQFVRLNREGVKAGLNFNDVKMIQLTKPPLTLQTCFASIVKSIEQQKARMQAHLAELDTLFAALQQRAFNGDL